MRRWAKSHDIPLAEAYLRGAEKVADILQVLRRHNVGTVSVYNLSRANLARTQDELQPVFKASIYFLTCLIPARFEPGECSVRLYGDRTALPEEYVAAARRAESVMHGDQFRINILAAYDANDELRAALRRAQQRGGEIRGAFDIEDVDLVIRTSPEPLLSGFLPLQTQYAQLRFSATPLNELEERHIDEFIDDYRRTPQLRGR